MNMNFGGQYTRTATINVSDFRGRFVSPDALPEPSSSDLDTTTIIIVACVAGGLLALAVLAALCPRRGESASPPRANSTPRGSVERGYLHSMESSGGGTQVPQTRARVFAQTMVMPQVQVENL